MYILFPFVCAKDGPRDANTNVTGTRTGRPFQDSLESLANIYDSMGFPRERCGMNLCIRLFLHVSVPIAALYSLSMSTK